MLPQKQLQPRGPAPGAADEKHVTDCLCIISHHGNRPQRLLSLRCRRHTWADTPLLSCVRLCDIIIGGAIHRYRKTSGAPTGSKQEVWQRGTRRWVEQQHTAARGCALSPASRSAAIPSGTPLDRRAPPAALRAGEWPKARSAPGERRARRTTRSPGRTRSPTGRAGIARSSRIEIFMPCAQSTRWASVPWLEPTRRGEVALPSLPCKGCEVERETRTRSTGRRAADVVARGSLPLGADGGLPEQGPASP